MLYHKLHTVVSRYLKVPIEYLGYVPQDEQLSRAVMQQMPVSIKNDSAKSAMAYKEIARKLMNGEKESPKVKRGMMAFFSHIMTGRR